MTTTKVLNGFKQWDSPTPFAADFVIWWKPQGANSLSPIEFVKPEKNTAPTNPPTIMYQIYQSQCFPALESTVESPYDR